MKNLFLLFLLVLSQTVFGQTPAKREVILFRHSIGSKELVVTYTGSGSAEQITQMQKFDAYGNLVATVQFGKQPSGKYGIIKTTSNEYVDQYFENGVLMEINNRTKVVSKAIAANTHGAEYWMYTSAGSIRQ
jgi:hypothetical protein